MPKFIRFEFDTGTHEGKPLFSIVNKRSNEAIGQVFWYGLWRQWTVRFREDSVWSQDCLADVREFIQRLNSENGPAITGSKKINACVTPQDTGKSGRVSVQEAHKVWQRVRESENNQEEP